MLLEVRDVDHDDFFLLALGDGLIALLVDALGADSDAIPHGLSARNLKGLVRPALDRNRHPRSLVTLRQAIEEVSGDCHGIGPQCGGCSRKAHSRG